MPESSEVMPEGNYGLANRFFSNNPLIVFHAIVLLLMFFLRIVVFMCHFMVQPSNLHLLKGVYLVS